MAIDDQSLPELVKEIRRQLSLSQEDLAREVGLRIGEMSLGDDFTGVLPWGLINNRPFLRCMHCYGLCL